MQPTPRVSSIVIQFTRDISRARIARESVQGGSSSANIRTMKRQSRHFWWNPAIGVGIVAASVFGSQPVAMDLVTLAKTVRPAVMMLVVSDSEGKPVAGGTGFLVSSDGMLVTNWHVVEKGNTAMAKAANGAFFPVVGVLASDPERDVVLLKLDCKQMTALSLGSIEGVEVGQRVAVLGNPLAHRDYEGTLSEGIVSGIREIGGSVRWLQITAAISKGSSGSPVFNTRGDVIGIATEFDNQGQLLNFAIPVEVAKRLVKSGRNAIPRRLHEETNLEANKIFLSEEWKAFVSSTYSGDSVEMLDRAKTLRKKYPDRAESCGALGFAYLLAKFNEEAAEAFRETVKLRPDHPLAWFLLGIAYSKLGKRVEAIEAQKRVIGLDSQGPAGWEKSVGWEDPVSWLAWREIGGLYAILGQVDDAVSACRQAITLNPERGEGWIDLGIAYNLQKKFGDAVLALRRGTTLKPNDAVGWNSLGTALGALGKHEDALDAYRRVTKLKPDYASGWFGFGASSFFVQNYGHAVTSLKEAIRLKPDYSDAWGMLYLTYAKMNQPRDALAALQQLRRIDPATAQKLESVLMHR